MLSVKPGLVLIFISGFLWAQQTKESGVNLAAAKKFAIEHNFEVLSFRKAHEEAQAAARRNRSNYYPKLGIAGGIDHKSDSKNNESAGVGYVYSNWNVFNGFNDRNQVEVADLEVEKAKIKAYNTAFRVGLEVERVFHLYLFKKDSLALKRESISLNDQHRQLAKQRRGSGLSADSDVMEFDLLNSLLRSDIALLQQELEEARTNLKKLLGEEIGSQIEPIGKLRHEHLNATLMDYIKKINATSETVLVAGRDVGIASVQARKWVSGWIPKFDVEARAGYLPLDTKPPQGGAAISVMGLLKLDVFSGLDTVFQRQEGVANQLKAEAQLKQQILSTVTQVDIAFRKIKTIQERVDLEEENLDRAEKYYKSVLSEYKRGLKNSIDLKQAAEVHFEAHLRREAYKYDFLVNRIELERSMGSAVQTEEVSEKEHAHSKKEEKKAKKEEDN